MARAEGERTPYGLDDPPTVPLGFVRLLRWSP